MHLRAVEEAAGGRAEDGEGGECVERAELGGVVAQTQGAPAGGPVDVAVHPRGAVGRGRDVGWVTDDLTHLHVR